VAARGRAGASDGPSVNLGAAANTGYRLSRTALRRRLLVLAVVVLAVLTATMLWSARRSRDAEVTRLAELLSLRAGTTVAEIGAGTGWLTVEVARRVGPSGRVYSTKLTAPRLDDIRHAAREAGLSNVTVLPAGDRTTKLGISPQVRWPSG
jgi:predicted methyltransferase